MKIILLLSLILIIVIVIMINNRNASTLNNIPQNMITQLQIPTPTASLIKKNDKERVIIIKILNKEESTELKIDTEFLTLLFDNLINLIQRLVKKLMNENNKILSKEEIGNLDSEITFLVFCKFSKILILDSDFFSISLNVEYK